jgi:hypothetical protein
MHAGTVTQNVTRSCMLLVSGAALALPSQQACCHHPEEHNQMADQSPSRPPVSPAIPVDALRQLLAALPADWQFSIEDRSLVLLFDADTQPRGSIRIVDGRLVRQDIADDDRLP